MEKIITNKYDATMSVKAIGDMINIRTLMNEARTLANTKNKDAKQKARYQYLCLQLHGFLGMSN